MTFVTKDKLGRDESESEESKEDERARSSIYSGESVSASNAFRLEIVTVRPSI